MKPWGSTVTSTTFVIRSEPFAAVPRRSTGTSSGGALKIGGASLATPSITVGSTAGGFGGLRAAARAAAQRSSNSTAKRRCALFMGFSPRSLGGRVPADHRPVGDVQLAFVADGETVGAHLVPLPGPAVHGHQIEVSPAADPEIAPAVQRDALEIGLGVAGRMPFVAEAVDVAAFGSELEDRIVAVVGHVEETLGIHRHMGVPHR